MIRKYLEKWRVPGFRNPKPVVAVVRLSGVISDRSGLGRSGLSAAGLVTVLETAFKMPNLKAVALAINSPGGSVTAGLAIYDTMQFVRPKVCTYCIGMAASMGAVLLVGGEQGHRYTLPNSRVLLHQPLISGTMVGPATQLDIEAQEILRLRDRLYEILAEGTGQDMEKIERDCDRDLWLDAAQSIEYGCVDQLLERMPDTDDE